MKTQIYLLASIGFLGFVIPTYATLWTLRDQNSRIRIEDDVIQGAYGWSVENPSVLKGGGGNFWYRQGSSGAESFLGSTAPVSASQSASNLLSVIYDLGTFELKADYELSGTPAGSMESIFYSSITLSNTSASSIELHMFKTWNYGFGSITNNSAQVIGGNQTLYEEGLFRGETTFTLTPDHIVVSDSELVAGPGGLGDSNPTTFPDIPGPVGPGVLREGYQWNIALAVGGTQTFTVEHHVFVVPEPSTMILMMIAGLGCWMRRRHIR